MASGSKWADVQVPADATLYVAQADISNYFYHLGIGPELRRFFSFPGIRLDLVLHQARHCVTLFSAEPQEAEGGDASTEFLV